MPRRNTSGQLVECGHCHYKWYTNTNNPVTSCPSCGWRVRVQATQREVQQENRELIPSRRDRGGFF